MVLVTKDPSRLLIWIGFITFLTADRLIGLLLITVGIFVNDSWRKTYEKSSDKN